jgi:transcriptional regulator of heat shock response
MKYLYEKLFNLNSTGYDFYQTGIINLLDNIDFMEGKKIRKVYDLLDSNEIFNYILVNDRTNVLFGSETHNLLNKGTIIVVPIIDHANNITGTLLCIGSERMHYNKVIPLLEYLSVSIGKRK